MAIEWKLSGKLHFPFDNVVLNASICKPKLFFVKIENMCISILKILNFFRGRFKRIASGWSRYDENYGLWKLWFIQGNNICMLSFYKVDTFRLTVVYMFFIYSYFKEKIYIGNAYCPILLNFFNKICSKFKLI